MRHSNHQQGYTLVELAIVLTIIGLLLLGVFRAEAMIDNARVQNDLKKLQALRVSYLLYKDQYHSLPGEDASHPGRFETVLSTDTNSSGFFYELWQAGFITKAGFNAEIGNAFKATWGGSSGANYGLIAGENQVCITDIDTGLAASIEAKLDNGNSHDGDMRYTANGSQLCLLMP